MYESKINICRYRIRNICLPRPPPDNIDMVHIIHNPSNHGVCPLNKIKPQSTTE